MVCSLFGGGRGAHGQARQQLFGALGRQVFLHQLDQAVALHQGAQHFGLALVEGSAPLGQRGVEGFVIPGLALGDQGHQRHGLVGDEGLAVGLLLPARGKPAAVRLGQREHALGDRLFQHGLGEAEEFHCVGWVGLSAPLRPGSA